MGPKRKAKAQQSGSSSKKAKAPASDWRSPLFYWRGSLQLGPRQMGTGPRTLTWKGTWVASEAGLPSTSEFKDSANTFTLTAQVPEDTPVMSEVASLSKPQELHSCNLDFDGSYLLDNGDGLASYSDLKHSVSFLQRSESKNGTDTQSKQVDDPHHNDKEGPQKPTASAVETGDAPASEQSIKAVLCGARGDTEFGPFVSLGLVEIRGDESEGTAEAGNSKALTLTLARRYLRDKDQRVKWNPESVIEAVTKDLISDPWEAIPWRV